MKHPVKMIKMGLDQTFIRFMWLNDLAFMWIAKRKYKGYRKRIKRVPYEDEAFQKDMEDTLDLCGKWVELVYDRMDAYPRYAYTPRRVVYAIRINRYFEFYRCCTNVFGGKKNKIY